MVEGEYPQAEVCEFQPRNRCRSAVPAHTNREKVQPRHCTAKTQIGIANQDSESVFRKPGEKSRLAMHTARVNDCKGLDGDAKS